MDGETVRRTIPVATYANVATLWRDFSAVVLVTIKNANAEQRTAGRPVEGAKKQAKVHKTASSLMGAAERFLSLKEKRQGRNITGKKSSSYINAKRTVDLFVKVCHSWKVYYVANIDNECVKAWLVAAKAKWNSTGTVAMLLRNLHGFLGTGKRKDTRGYGLGLNTDAFLVMAQLTKWERQNRQDVIAAMEDSLIDDAHRTKLTERCKSLEFGLAPK